MCRPWHFADCRPADTSQQKAPADPPRPSLSPGSFSSFERAKPADMKAAPNSPTKLISTANDAVTTGARLVVPHRVNASVNLLSQFSASAPGDSWVAPIGSKTEGSFVSMSPSPAILSSPSFQLSSVAPVAPMVTLSRLLVWLRLRPLLTCNTRAGRANQGTTPAVRSCRGSIVIESVCLFRAVCCDHASLYAECVVEYG